MQPTASEVQPVADVWRLAVALSLALIGAQPVLAQFPREIVGRTRVRVTVQESSLREHESRNGWIVGEVVRVTHDTLHVRVDDTTPPIAIPRILIERMQRSLGTRTLSTCTRTGQVIGAVVGASLLVVGFTSNEFGPREGAAVLIGFWGGIIDALSRSECWRDVRLR